MLQKVFDEREKLEPQTWGQFRNIIENKLSLGSLNLREEK